MSRVRTRNITSNYADVHEEWYRYGGPGYDGQLAFASTVPVPATATFEGMVDREIDQFHLLKKKGQLFFNPMVREQMSYHGQPVGLKLSAWLGTRHDYGTLVPRGNPVPSFAPLIVVDNPGLSYENVIKYLSDNFDDGPPDVAVTKAWSKIDQTVLPLLVTLGEGKETLGTIIKLFRRLISFFRFLHSGRKSQLEYALKGDKTDIALINKKLRGISLTSEWMEIRYALRPLMYELGAAFDLLDAKLKRLSRMTCRGNEVVLSSSTNTARAMYDAYTGVEYQVQQTLTRRCRAGVLFGFLNNNVSFAQLLGLDRPVGALLELTKLSFVLDWIINIGSYIASWEQNTSLTVHGCWCTDEVLIRETYFSPTVVCTWGIFGYTDIESEVTPASSTWTRERYVAYRNPAATRPLTPSIKLRLNWAKVIDLAIILKQLIAARR